jgi:antitoxin MazE
MSHIDMLRYALFKVKRITSATGGRLLTGSTWNIDYDGAMRIRLRPVGNSQRLADTAEAGMTVARNALVVRRIAPARQSGWAEAAKTIAAAGDDALVLGDFNNESDAEIVW